MTLRGNTVLNQDKGLKQETFTNPSQLVSTKGNIHLKTIKLMKLTVLRKSVIGGYLKQNHTIFYMQSYMQTLHAMHHLYKKTCKINISTNLHNCRHPTPLLRPTIIQIKKVEEREGSKREQSHQVRCCFNLS